MAGKENVTMALTGGPQEIAAAAAAVGMTIEDFMRNRLGQQTQQQDDRLLMVKEAVKDLSDRDKLKQNSIFDQDFLYYMMKFCLVDRGYLSFYQGVEVVYSIEKTVNPPFYAVKAVAPGFDNLKERQLENFRELQKDFMELRISMGGQGRKDKKEILSGLSQDQLMNARMGLLAGLRDRVGGWISGRPPGGI